VSSKTKATKIRKSIYQEICLSSSTNLSYIWERE